MRIGKAEISEGFLFLSAWLLYQDTSGVVWQGLLACALHELGHLVVLRLIGKTVVQMRVTAFGAQIRIVGGMSYPQELFAAAAGPAVNLLLAYLTCAFPKTRVFAGENIALAAFNLLPAGELDGARMLRSLLHLLCSDKMAEFLSNGADRLCSFFFVAAGLAAAALTGNVTLSLVSLWLLKRADVKKDCFFRKKERNRSCHMVWKRLE